MEIMLTTNPAMATPLPGLLAARAGNNGDQRRIAEMRGEGEEREVVDVGMNGGCCDYRKNQTDYPHYRAGRM